VSRPYSVRFLAAQNAAGYTPQYAVPAGYRAVIRSADFTSQAPADSWAAVIVSGVAVWYWVSPGSTAAHHWDTRQVFYAGQTIMGYMSATSMGMAVSGYLFVDDSAHVELLPQPTPPNLPPPGGP